MSTAPLPPRSDLARIVIAMGVSGAGKTAFGKALARRLHAPFLDGDDYHPEANLEKMRAGIALDDDDRWPWLDALGKALHAAARRKGVAVGACSALRLAYRNRLIEKAGEPILFVHLSGPRDLLARRVAARQNHFMPPSLLDSQLATLEAPEPRENAVTLDIAEPVERMVTRVAGELGHLRTFRRWQ